MCIERSRYWCVEQDDDGKVVRSGVRYSVVELVEQQQQDVPKL
eukprot:COSAG05_NODE_4304_length_1574_cov_16.284746_2_plen_43_part_00